MAETDILEDTVAQLQALADQEAMELEVADGEPEDELPEGIQKILDWAESKENITPHLSDDTKEKILRQVELQYENDKQSMRDWEKKYKVAMDLATMMKSAGKKMTPFEGASKFMSPYVMEAAIDFNSRMLMEVMSRKEPARYEMWGNKKAEDYPEADRCSDYMNYLLVNEMNWEDETDLESLVLPIVGTTFKKLRYCADTDSYESMYANPKHVVFNHKSKAFKKAPQVCDDDLEFNKNEIVGAINAGLWEYDIDQLERSCDENSDKTSWEAKEYHFWYDLDGDGYCEPYIAIVLEEDSDEANSLVSLIPAFDAEDVILEGDKITSIERIQFFSQKQFIKDPMGSPMGTGWGILFSDIFKTINTNTRQLVDAGTLQNNAANSGFISSSLSPAMGPSRQREGSLSVAMGKYQRVQTSGGQSLRESIVQLPVQGPSGVLFELLQHLEEACRRTTNAAYNVEANQNEAASLYLARLQQALKTPNAIMIRVFRGLKEEFNILANLIYRYGNDEDYNMVVATDDQKFSIESDFNPDTCNMTPTADLSHGSDVERIAKVNAIMDIARDPQLAAQVGLDPREAFKKFLLVTGESEDEIERLQPPPSNEPSPAEQQMIAQQQAMMDFANRELMLKEQDLALKMQKAALDAQREAAELRIKAEESQTKQDLDRAKTAETLAKITQGDFDAQLRLIDQLARQQEKQADAYNQAGGSRLAATSSNSRGRPSAP